MYKPAIVVVGYNRPKQTLRLLESIGRANYLMDNIPLIVSIDQSDLSDEVERLARTFTWTHGELTIRRFPERQGLRKHIVSCGDLSEQYGSVIILEDDLYVAEDFYNYCCQAHEYYSQDSRICGISLYNFRRIPFTNYTFLAQKNNYDTYLGQMVVTWGQSWSKEQWKNFKKWYLEHEDKLPEENLKIPDEISGWKRSWGKYFSAYIAEKGLFYVYPYTSRTTCFSDVGEHNADMSQTAISQVPLMHGIVETYKFAPVDNAVRYDSFYEYIPDIDQAFCGITGDQITFDLNGMKRSSLGKKYIISSQKLDSKIIGSFGLAMRPVEENVLHNVDGTYYSLYELRTPDLPFRAKNNNGYRYTQDYNRIRYEHNDLTWRTLMKYTFWELRSRIYSKIRK